MARSTHADRSSSAQRVLDRAKEGASPSARPLFEQSASLCDQLIRVCAFQPKPLANGRSAKSFSVRSEFPALRRLAPCDVMVPNQTQLAPTLPPPRARNAANPNHVPTVSEWNAFPDDVVTIAEFEDDVPVLSSLQKPKKLTVLGSDGTSQSFMCKPKDDLRKDLRRMEFTTMLNRLLSRDPRRGNAGCTCARSRSCRSRRTAVSSSGSPHHWAAALLRRYTCATACTSSARSRR